MEIMAVSAWIHPPGVYTIRPIRINMRMESTMTDIPVISPAAPLQSAPALVRALGPQDSMAELTALLHRAYRKQVEMGLRPLAGRQTEEVTRARTSHGECFVATLGGTGAGAESRLVGTILFQEKEDARFPGHFLVPGVAHFSLLAVDPDAQGRGIGHLLLATVEDRARALGFNELACSMAEPDEGLMRFYLRNRFRFVEHWQWPYTNYRSAILSRTVS